jgi:hypothetical protein
MSQGLGNTIIWKNTMPLILKKPFRNPNPLIIPQSTTHHFVTYPWHYVSKYLGLRALAMVKGGDLNLGS